MFGPRVGTNNLSKSRARNGYGLNICGVPRFETSGARGGVKSSIPLEIVELRQMKRWPSRRVGGKMKEKRGEKSSKVPC